MQKYIIPIAALFCLAGCQPEQTEEKVKITPQIETPDTGENEEEPKDSISINDFKPGSSGEAELTEKE